MNEDHQSLKTGRRTPMVEPCPEQRPRIPVARYVLSSIACAGLLAIGMFLWTWASSGRSIAERAATSLAMPIGILWLIIFAATCWCALQRRRIGFLLVLSIWLLLSISHNRYFATWIFQFVEHPFVEVDETPNRFRTVFVLGGGAGIDPEGKPQMGGDGQRLVYAARLWHAGVAQSIVCTGSKPLGRDPSDIGRELLTSIGVDDKDIYEIKGDNTSEEMQHAREFLDDLPDGFPTEGEIALITSAYHMPRAQRLANANGLELAPLPCNYRVRGKEVFSPWYLLPESGAASTVGAAIKEMLAALVGR